MKHVDYIIVGLGIAGLCFAEQLRQRQQSFIVINKLPNTSTAVSGGIMNPTVLKRFTAAWQADFFMKEAVSFYQGLEKHLSTHLIKPIPILRIFKNIEEQNNWMVASEKQVLKEVLNEVFQFNDNSAINAPMGMGEVKGGFALQPAYLLQEYAQLLSSEGALETADFDYSSLKISEANLQYKNIVAKQIVFAEGAQAIHNPYFHEELLRPNKGEYIVFTSEELQLKYVLKGPVMIIPLGENHYKAGATFSRTHNSDTSQEAREEIIRKLKTMLHCEFNVVDQMAGVRPTVKDRRPLLGTSEVSKRIHLFNGLGTRGLMMAPALSEMLYKYIENGTALPKEVDVQRF